MVRGEKETNFWEQGVLLIVQYVIEKRQVNLTISTGIDADSQLIRCDLHKIATATMREIP